MAVQAWDGPVVDAHHHFWEPQVNHHPWLAPGAAIPFRYGSYESIKRRYLPEEYRRDAVGHDVVQTVYVETEWDPADPIGETRYASLLAERSGWPNAIVAQAWLHHDDAAEVLAEQASFPLVRSVRHKPGGPASPAEVGGSRSLMSDPAWRRGFAALAPNGLHFDLQAPWWNLAEAEALAGDFPATDHHSQPCRAAVAARSGEPGRLARGHGRPGPAPERDGEGLGHRRAGPGLDGGEQWLDCPDRDRAVWGGTVDVRQQLPGRQSVRHV